MPGYPPPCDEPRRIELRGHLVQLAKRTTEKGTLTALAKQIGVTKHTVSHWIQAGEVHPWKARDMLALAGANDSDNYPITLKDLTPSLFTV